MNRDSEEREGVARERRGYTIAIVASPDERGDSLCLTHKDILFDGQDLIVRSGHGQRRVRMHKELVLVMRYGRVKSGKGG